MHTLAGRHIWASCGAWTNIIPQQKCYISQLCIISAVTGERKRERSKKHTQAVDAAYIISYLAICNVCCASDGDGRTAFCAGQSDSIKNKFFLYMKMLYVRQYKYEKHEAALLALHVDMWLCDCDMFTMYVCACCVCVCVCVGKTLHFRMFIHVSFNARLAAVENQHKMNPYSRTRAHTRLQHK